MSELECIYVCLFVLGNLLLHEFQVMCTIQHKYTTHALILHMYSYHTCIHVLIIHALLPHNYNTTHVLIQYMPGWRGLTLDIGHEGRGGGGGGGGDYT